MMVNSAYPTLLANDRFAVYRWLNGQAEEATAKPRTTLVKTFPLEMARAPVFCRRQEEFMKCLWETDQ